eukprot:3651939-Rhodomonas_salina.1
MLDMGADYETLQGNCYATLFVVKRTRFLMAFLHSSKDGHVIADMMCKARAKIGSWPTHMRSDGAAEYNSPEVRDLFQSNNIEHEWSNPGEQHTNGAAETLVNRLGRGIRVLLLFSGLAPEFWGLALLNVVDVYNCLPHSSLKFEI